MKHLLFKANDTHTYPIGILIKTSALTQMPLISNYVKPLYDKGIPIDNFIAYDLHYDKKKVTAKAAKAHLQEVLTACVTLHTKTLLVADASYFKFLTKERKAEPHLGYIKKCAIEGYEHKEIAEMLGISVNTSKTQLFKARKMLQHLLNKSM